MKRVHHTLLLAYSFLALWPFVTTAQSLARYQSLDPQHPITISKGVVSFGGQQWTIGPKTFLIDQQLTSKQCETSPYIYNSIQEAAANLTDGKAEEPMTLLFAPGVYWVDNPDDPEVRRGKDGQPPFGMVIHCDKLHLIGLTDNPQHVVLASQRGQTQGAIGNFTMFSFHTDSLWVKNLTMGNYCNVDLDYPLSPTLSRPKKSEAITQAQVAFCDGDWVDAVNCRFVSRLNLCPIVGSKDALYTNCHFESTDDALNGSAIYNGCDFDFYAPKPLWSTSGYGAVFVNCDFNVCHGNHEQYFCKHPGQVTVIDCRFHAPEGTYIGWTPNAPKWLRNYQSSTTLNGQPILIGSHQPENSITDRPSSLIGQQIHINHHEATLLTGGDNLHLVCRLTNRKHCQVESNCQWRVEPGYEQYVQLVQDGSTACIVKPTNEKEEAATFCIIATTPAGYEAACKVTVLPRKLPAPTFSRLPRIVVKDGVAWLDGQLSLNGRNDESDITWLRIDPISGRETVAAVSTKGRPTYSYQLMPPDAGKQLVAVVCPKSARSDYGDTIRTAPTKVIKAKGIIPTNTWETDFHDFPCMNQPQIMEGEWTIGGHKPADTDNYPWTIDSQKQYWHYGTGINGCKGEGLLQDAQGARMVYTPLPANYGNMSLELWCDPSKTAGQGFSSALGQYMDLYIKYDTRARSGYGLRIIRTTKYANAVDFILMRYDNEKATPLTEALSTTCFRTGCTIQLAYEDGQLMATATTTTPQPDSPLAKKVKLSANVPHNTFGGIGIQHTGTTGEGTTMLHRLRVTFNEDTQPSVPTGEYLPADPNYDNPSMWITEDGDSLGTGADIFYVVSTWELDWQAADGSTAHYADVWNPLHRQHMATEINAVAKYMAPGNRFYAPFYRHATIEAFLTLNDDSIRRRTRIAMQDVCDAFDRFLQQRDTSRPLILAGFSQGGMAMVELLKHISDETYDQIAATYIMGYQVTPQDTATCRHIRPAQRADDTGVTICYNTMKDVRYVNPVISATCIGINPVNWRTDDTPAILHDSITVTLSPKYHVLIVKGYDGAEYRPFRNFINVGDIHSCEPYLYSDCLRQNFAVRTRAFREKKANMK